MITALKENERLICVGKIALRAPNGTPLPAVPQYIIVPIGEAAADCIVELKDNERLVLIGTEHTDRKSAEERYAALKAGKEPPPQVDGKPLYIKENADNINPKTGLSEGEEKAIEPLLGDILAEFAVAMREFKSLERADKPRRG